MTPTKAVISGWFSDFANPSILSDDLVSLVPQQQGS